MIGNMQLKKLSKLILNSFIYYWDYQGAYALFK